MRNKEKSRDKPYFAHDENLEFLQLRKKCNKLALFTSFVRVMKKQGVFDAIAIRECNKRDFHIITHNTEDFRKPSAKIKIGIICIGLKNEDIWIPKIIKLFRRYPKHKDYYNKNIFISNGITIEDRKSLSKQYLT